MSLSLDLAIGKCFEERPWMFELDTGVRLYYDSVGSAGAFQGCTYPTDSLPNPGSNCVSAATRYSFYARVEAMLGVSSIGNSTTSLTKDYFSESVVAADDNITVSHLSLYVQNATGNARLGIYADNSGSPGSLLAQTAELTLINGW